MVKPGDPLNILILITDQHHAHALGCAGNTDIQTPNLDRLAGEGIIFDNAITPSGACRPAKMSILTGLHPRTHGLLNQKKETPDVPAHTLGRLYRDAGYKTAFFGKNHMPEKMQELGFDIASTGPKPFENSISAEAMVARSPLPNEEHSAGIITSMTLDFLESHGDAPFCAVSSHYGPHQPIHPSEPWASQYDPSTISLPPNHRYDAERMPSSLDFARKKWANMHPESEEATLAFYYGLVSQIDYNFGRILDRLEERNILDRTVIIFLSDHGEFMGEHGVWSKEAVGYEAVVRIPFIWRLPGGEPGGERRAQVVSSLDLLPTLLDITGLPDVPEIEGKSLLPVLHDPNHEGKEFDVSELFGDHHGKFCSTVRSRKWKYFRIVSASDPIEEFLFDLEKDPWEMHDLSTAADSQSVLDQCREWLDHWQRETRICPTARNQLAAAGIQAG